MGCRCLYSPSCREGGCSRKAHKWPILCIYTPHPTIYIASQLKPRSVGGYVECRSEAKPPTVDRVQYLTLPDANTTTSYWRSTPTLDTATPAACDACSLVRSVVAGRRRVWRCVCWGPEAR